MGMPPDVVDRQTPAAMFAAFDGFRQFHGGKRDGDEISDEEFLATLAREQAAGRTIN